MDPSFLVSPFSFPDEMAATAADVETFPDPKTPDEDAFVVLFCAPLMSSCELPGEENISGEQLVPSAVTPCDA